MTSVTLRNVGTDGDFAARQANSHLLGLDHSEPANYPDLVRESDSTTTSGCSASSQRSQ